MSTVDTINAVHFELNATIEKFSEALQVQDMGGCFDHLDTYFSLMRQADADRLLNDDQLKKHVQVWSAGVIELSQLSHLSAFTLACSAWKTCESGHEKKSVQSIHGQ